MKKRTLIILAVLLVLITAITYLFFLNFEFGIITLVRGIAVEQKDNYGYMLSIQEMKKFAESGIYQNWLTQSGATVFGKILRAIVVVAETTIWCIAVFAVNEIRMYMKNINKKSLHNQQ